LQRWSPRMLSILRIVDALLLLQFGMAVRETPLGKR
jgi:hypothetical protein